MTIFDENEFTSHELSCTTGGLFPDDLDYERLQEVGVEDTIIGWIDAPSVIPTGACERGVDFLGHYFGQQVIERDRLMPANDQAKGPATAARSADGDGPA